MQFKDLQAGSSVFVLLKGDAPDYRLEKKVGVLKDRRPLNVQNQRPQGLTDAAWLQLQQVQQMAPQMTPHELVIEIDGELVTIQNVNMSLEAIEDPRIFISSDKASLKKKVDDILEVSKNHLAIVPKYKSYVEHCEFILRDLDENYQKSLETDHAVRGMQEELAATKAMLLEMQQTNKQLLKLVQDNLVDEDEEEPEAKPKATTKKQ